jgi:hypothetical protein
LGLLHLEIWRAQDPESGGWVMAVAAELEILKELQERVEELRGYL